MALAFGFLRRFFGDLVVELELGFGLSRISNLPISLSQAIVRLFHFRICLNGLLIVRNRLRIIFLLGMQNAELEIGGSKLRIEMNRILQQGLDLRRRDPCPADPLRSFHRPTA